MSSAGSVLAMIQSLRNNKNLLKTREKYFSGLNNRIAKQYRHHSKQHKQMSNEQLEKLRAKLIRESRTALIKKCLALTIALCLTVLIVLWLNNNVELEDFNQKVRFKIF